MTTVLLLVLVLVLIALVVLVVVLVRGRRSRAESGGTAPAPPRDPLADAATTAGDPRKLKAGDVVDYLGRRYFVRGSLRLAEGGYAWSEHFLDDAEGTKRWISVEEDPDLEVVMWVEHGGGSLTPADRTVVVDGVEYRRVEHGTARFRSEGTTGLGDTGHVEYADYEAPGGRYPYLSFERFGGAGSGAAWEAGLGEKIPNGTLTIFPAG